MGDCTHVTHGRAGPSSPLCFSVSCALPMKQWFRYARGLLVAVACVAMALIVIAWLALPDVRAKPPAYTPQQLVEAEAARDVRFNPNDPSQLPVLHVDVNPDEGDAAPWWPKNESPLLRELVDEGALPPVHERTGPEPCVMRGVDGIGHYGGTWHRIATHDEDIDVIRWRLSGTGLVRWSPLGYPIKPHLAKRVEINNGNREFVFHLRKGVRWSDGHPFTVDDILYWWDEERDPVAGYGVTPKWMRSAGQPARLDKINDLT